MKLDKQRRLAAAGFKIGTADEFLGLSPSESALVSMRLTLAKAVRKNRLTQRFSQVELARRLGSSQSRVAKIEAAAPSVSFDLLVRAMLATGVKRREIGRVIAGA